MAGAAGLAGADAASGEVQKRDYRKVLLVDIHGDPIRAGALAAETNYVFQYPYAATPCFLLRLPKAVRSGATLRRENGTRYEWSGGVGPDRAIVAFSAICAHKLAYPTKEVSFIRYQRERSPTSGGAVIHCCADHSVYDPLEGARVVSGPAPQPLAAIALDHEPSTDRLYATGTIGAAAPTTASTIRSKARASSRAPRRSRSPRSRSTTSRRPIASTRPARSAPSSSTRSSRNTSSSSRSSTAAAAGRRSMARPSCGSSRSIAAIRSNAEGGVQGVVDSLWRLANLVSVSTTERRRSHADVARVHLQS